MPRKHVPRNARLGARLASMFLKIPSRAMVGSAVAVAMIVYSSPLALANQFSAITTFSSTLVGAALNSMSNMGTVLSQIALGPVNQDALWLSDASTITGVNGNLTADNVAGINQFETGVGLTNQLGSIDAGALTVAGIGMDAGSAALSDITQAAAGPANQEALGATVAGTLVDSDIGVATFNGLGVTQLADDGLINQGADVNAGALSAVGQGIDADSVGFASVLQLADGPANQIINNLNVSNTIIGAMQNVLTLNLTGIFQGCNGICNQNANVNVGAESDVGQALSGNSTTVDVLSQLSAGGPANQSICCNFSSALTFLTGGQTVVTGNSVGLTQIGIGAAANQDATVNALALGVGNQLVSGTSTDLNVLTQGNLGGAANQNMANLASATDIVSAGQGILSSNDAVIGQTNVGGPANQSVCCSNLVAAAGGLQVVSGNALTTNVLGQSNLGGPCCGGANQEALSDATALDTVLAGQGISATNESLIGQTNVGGAANQAIGQNLGAFAQGEQVVLGNAAAANVIGQGNVGGNANQLAGANTTAIDTTVGGQEVGAGNTAVFGQTNVGGCCGDGANMFIGADMDATALGDQTVIGPASATTLIGQGNVGGSATQLAGANTTAVDTAVGGQSVGAGNLAVADQTNVGGMGNFVMGIGQGAGAVGSQVIGGSATALTGIGQGNVGGSANQAAGANTTAVDTTIGGQNVSAGNLADLSQTNVGGSANMVAGLDMDATAVGVQAVLGTAVAGTEINQGNVGGGCCGGSANQLADADSLAASTAVGSQNVGATNLAGLDQVNLGGSANQSVCCANLSANAVGVQGVGATAVDGTSINQGNIGGDANQTASSQSAALGVAAAEQTVGAGNLVDVEQINLGGGCCGGGSANQNLLLGADADAVGVQEVGAVALDETEINQGNIGGNANQSVCCSESTVVAGAVADQNIGAGNVIGVSQLNAALSGGTGQNIAIDADADATGDQSVTSLGVGSHSIDQGNIGGSANQGASQVSEVVSDADANQNVEAGNSIIAGQTSALIVGAGAQSMEIAPTTTAHGSQDLDSLALNGQSIDQGNVGGNANQEAGNLGVAATDVDANQNVTAQTNIGAFQDLDAQHGAGAQYMMVAPTTTATADQNVGAGALNEQSVDQGNIGGCGACGGGANQEAANIGGATTDVDANQGVSAVTNVLLLQGANIDHGAAAQAVEVTSDTTAAGEQDVGAGSANGQSIDQANIGGNANQNGLNVGGADTSVGADQDISAETNIGVLQGCDVNHGACAQFAEVGGGSHAAGQQGVGAVSENDQSIDQANLGGAANQEAANLGGAATDVEADQDVGAQTNTGISQVCSASGGACAQYAGDMSVSDTTANQQILAGAVNDSAINQLNVGGPANQSAVSNGSALTGVSATQNAQSATNTLINQLAGPGGNQSANVAGGATTNATSTINAGSSNTTVINQAN